MGVQMSLKKNVLIPASMLRSGSGTYPSIYPHALLQVSCDEWYILCVCVQCALGIVFAAWRADPHPPSWLGSAPRAGMR